MEKDKVYHFTVSFIIALVLSHLISTPIAFLTTILIGYLKELYDKYIKGTYIDQIDLLADLLGALVGVAVVIIGRG